MKPESSEGAGVKVGPAVGGGGTSIVSAVGEGNPVAEGVADGIASVNHACAPFRGEVSRL